MDTKNIFLLGEKGRSTCLHSLINAMEEGSTILL